MNNKNNKNRITVSWGNGISDHFLDICSLEVFDYYHNMDELHNRCGGHLTYLSRTCYTGEGYLEKLGTLIPVGSYETSARRVEFAVFETVGTADGTDVEVTIPQGKRPEVLRNKPAVIKTGFQIIYTDFYGNFREILKSILRNEDIGKFGKKKTLKKCFSKQTAHGLVEDEIELEFYNLCTVPYTPNPWFFYRGELREYEVEVNKFSERVYDLLGIAKLDDTFVKLTSIRGRKYHGEVIGAKNPLDGDTLPSGWQRLAPDVIAKSDDQNGEILLVAYTNAEKAYGRHTDRVIRHMPDFEKDRAYLSGCQDEYVEKEVTVSRALFFLDQEDCIKRVREGLAKDVLEDMWGRVRCVVRNLQNQVV